MAAKKLVNICFVANFYKTFFFHELSKALAANEVVNVYWIVTKLNQYTFLKENYPAENILYINRDFINYNNTPVGDFKLNEIVYGDRVFSHEIQNGINFLTNIQRPIYDFIAANKIRFIFGEITWAHELVIHRMTKHLSELNCMYLDCSLVRIPNNRFAFFTDETQYEMLQFDGEPANKVIQLEKPAYLHINDKIVKANRSIFGRMDRVKRFITGENIEKKDPNVIVHTKVRFKVSVEEEINKSTYRFIPTTPFNEIENEKYIFIGFHKQPESSIDVIGRYYEDQAMNVINLWRLLPQGWKIVVKEHTNAIGDRSYNFYKRLLKYPNIIIAKENIDSKLLIEKSQLVATVSGTIAYEAALLKKPAVTFSKVFFTCINYCIHKTIQELSQYQSLELLVQQLTEAEDNRLEFSNYLLKNTFDGYITDPVTDKSVLDEANLAKIVKAFYKLFELY